MAASRKAAHSTGRRTGPRPTIAHRRAAPVGRLAKGRRVTGDQRREVTEAIRRRYLAGESIRSLADDLGRSYGFVHRILVDDAVPLRGRGGATRGRRQ